MRIILLTFSFLLVACPGKDQQLQQANQMADAMQSGLTPSIRENAGLDFDPYCHELDSVSSVAKVQIDVQRYRELMGQADQCLGPEYDTQAILMYRAFAVMLSDPFCKQGGLKKIGNHNDCDISFPITPEASPYSKKLPESVTLNSSDNEQLTTNSEYYRQCKSLECLLNKSQGVFSDSLIQKYCGERNQEIAYDSFLEPDVMVPLLDSEPGSPPFLKAPVGQVRELAQYLQRNPKFSSELEKIGQENPGKVSLYRKEEQAGGLFIKDQDAYSFKNLVVSLDHNKALNVDVSVSQEFETKTLALQENLGDYYHTRKQNYIQTSDDSGKTEIVFQPNLDKYLDTFVSNGLASKVKKAQVVPQENTQEGPSSVTTRRTRASLGRAPAETDRPEPVKEVIPGKVEVADPNSTWD